MENLSYSENEWQKYSNKNNNNNMRGKYFKERHTQQQQNREIK